MNDTGSQQVSIEIGAHPDNKARHHTGVGLVTALLESGSTHVSVFFYSDAVELLYQHDSELLRSWERLLTSGGLSLSICQTALERRGLHEKDQSAVLSSAEVSSMVMWMNTVLDSDRHLVL